jgi:hypothetical protein
MMKSLADILVEADQWINDPNSDIDDGKKLLALLERFYRVFPTPRGANAIRATRNKLRNA